MSVVLALDSLSPTQIGNLLECEERWAFKYIVGEREPGTEATATGIGFGVAIEDGDLEAGLRAYEKARPPVDELWDDPDTRENERLVARASITHALASYRLRYAQGDAEAGVKPEVEYVVQCTPGKRGEPTPLLYVRTDGACPTFGVEVKFRSGSSLGAEQIAQECARGHQLTAEVYVMWRKTGELLPVKFRPIRKPNRTKTKALKLDAEAIDAYVREHFETSEKAFDERIVTRTLEDMLRFERELRRLWVQRMGLLSGKQPVRNPSSCFSYGRVCPFAERCGVAS
jgi:hypothetical protein